MKIVLLLSCLFALFVQAQTRTPAQVAGIYEGAIPVKGSDARKLTLRLKQDGSVEFHDATQHATGTWSVEKEDLRVELKDRPAMALLWRVKGNLLAPKEWDRAVYGKKGPVLRRPR